MRALSIQSQVIYGHVGNNAGVFAQAYTYGAGLGRYGLRQSPKAAAFIKMRIYNHILQKAKTQA